MATVHLVCPFPPCTAEWWTGLEPGQTRVSVPYHLPEGDFEGIEGYTVRCPGALAMFNCETRELELVPLSAEQVERAAGVYRVRLASKREREQRAAEAEQGTGGHWVGGPLGRPANLSQHGSEMYFPGRPADAPEPGVGEPPAMPVEIGTGHHLGRAAMDNAHSTTKGLADLAINQMGLTQDLLARITASLEEAEALAVAAEAQIHAVSSLVTSAVGTGADAGANGEAMAEQTMLALGTIGGENADNIQVAIQLAKIRVELAHQQITGAVTAGKAYSASLGRA